MPTLQEMIDAAVYADPEGRPVGDTVSLGPGILSVNDTVRIENVRGLRIVGDGTRIIYSGDPAKPVFRFAQAFQCSLENLEIVGTAPTRSAVQITNLPGPHDWITSACRFTDVNVPHAGLPPFTDAFEIDSYAAGGSDQNNEQHVFERVCLNNFTRSGFRIRGGQIHQLVFRDCQCFDHGARGQFGVFGEYGCYFDWLGGCINASQSADFYLKDFVTRVSVRNFNGENSRRFLITDGPTGAPLPVSIDGVRWDGQPNGQPVISYLSPGPLTVANANFTAIDGTPCRLLSSPPTGTTEYGSLSVRNCVLGQSGGSYAPLERPVRFGPAQELDGFGLTYRWYGSTPESNAFKLSWPPDLLRRAVMLPALPTQYTTEGPKGEASLTTDMSQGWTMSCTAMLTTLNPAAPNPHILALYAPGTSNPFVKVWVAARTQWRLEATGIQINLPLWDVNVPQKVLAWWDRETGECGLRVGTVESKSNIASFPAPTLLGLGEESTGASSVRFDGTITDVRLWGRMLYPTERAMV